MCMYIYIYIYIYMHKHIHIHCTHSYCHMHTTASHLAIKCLVSLVLHRALCTNTGLLCSESIAQRAAMNMTCHVSCTVHPLCAVQALYVPYEQVRVPATSFLHARIYPQNHMQPLTSYLSAVVQSMALYCTCINTSCVHRLLNLLTHTHRLPPSWLHCL